MEPNPIRKTNKGLRDLADHLKALADETRLSILTMLLDGEMCVCEIMDALPLSQPTISHHLKVLRQAGLVTDRREGKWIYYDINPAGLKSIRGRLNKALLLPLQAEAARGGSSRRRRPPCRED